MNEQLNKRQLQYQQTLEHIRQSTDRLAMDTPLNSITIRDICREAGITVGTFYHYFPSKADLLIDRSVRTQEYFMRFRDQSLLNLEPEKALIALTEEFRSYLYSRVVPIMIEFHKAYVDNKKDFSYDFLEAISVEIFEKGQQTGVFRQDYDAHALAGFYSFYLHGLSTAFCKSKGGIIHNLPLNQLFIQQLLLIFKCSS